MDRTLLIEKAAPNAPVTLVGRVLGERWTLVRLLGTGGTASVYEAVHRNGRRVAIKVLHPALARERVARKRFQSEGYAANRVRHPNAVAIMDDGEDPDGTVFLVMELLDGYPLVTPLNEGRALPVPAVAMLASSVLDVLAAAHENGVVHRDVKPANIFMTRDGQVKLLDFGVARVDRLGVSVITQAGSAVGTPEFMAPEQAAGRADQVDALTDIWAVGATMFQLLTRRLVHDVTTARDVIVAAATKPAPLLRSVNASVPEPVARVVDRALAFNRAERWPNARAMRQALLAACPELTAPGVVDSLGAHTQPEGSRGARRPQLSPVPAGRGEVGTKRRYWQAALVCCVLALFGVASLAVWLWVGARRTSALALSAEPSAQAVPVSTPTASAAAPTSSPAPAPTVAAPSVAKPVLRNETNAAPAAATAPSASSALPSDPQLDQRK